MRSREALGRIEMEAVLTAARCDIEASLAEFCVGQDALARTDRDMVAAQRDLSRLDLSDLGVVLAMIVDRFDGIVPSQQMMRDGDQLWRLRNAIGDHGGVRRVAQYLHATHETLAPFMIAIAAQTYANPEALRTLRRDCMSEHLLLDRRVVVSWRKGGANREQRRSFLRDRDMSAPNPIDRLLAMTNRLVSHVNLVGEGRCAPNRTDQSDLV